MPPSLVELCLTLPIITSPARKRSSSSRSSSSSPTFSTSMVRWGSLSCDQKQEQQHQQQHGQEPDRKEESNTRSSVMMAHVDPHRSQEHPIRHTSKTPMIEAGCDTHAFLESLSARVDRLNNEIEASVSSSSSSSEGRQHTGNAVSSSSTSPVIAACRASLRVRMSLLLKQASLVVASANAQGSEGRDESEQMIAKLRATFALCRVSQYLEMIELAMTERESLDARFAEILSLSRQQPAWGESSCVLLDPSTSSSSSSEDDSEKKKNGHGDDADHDKDEYGLRVSPWAQSCLVFELLYGKAASLSLNDPTCPPLNVVVEPLVELPARDLDSGSMLATYLPCKATIEKCKHDRVDFHAGAGTIGTALIKVRLDPLDCKDKLFRVWNHGAEITRKLRIKEARVIQRNAYPPKPKAVTDTYTSCVYGDRGITITLIVKTYETTEVTEPPKVHIEVFLAPSTS